MASAALVPHSLIDATNLAREFARRSKSAQTLRCYATDWRDFSEWCGANGVVPLPATGEVVAMYLSSLASNRKVNTIQRRLSAISQVHQMRGFESPSKSEVVRSVMKGIRRSLGVACNEKSPLLASDVRAMVATLPDTLNGKRDRALLLLGFSGAFRRSELVSLNVEDVAFTDEGAVVMLRRSKTDQEGQGRKIGIPRLATSDACPVAALQVWLEASGNASGPLFRPVALLDRISSKRLSDSAVAKIVKKRLPSGLDPTKFAGHSLRAGFVTSAANGGASVKSIMRQTGHRSLDTLMRYMRDASLFRGNALGATGL